MRVCTLFHTPNVFVCFPLRPSSIHDTITLTRVQVHVYYNVCSSLND